MKWTGLNDLREQFLSFFESKNHTRLGSFSLVPPADDPSLLLINSGMAPLKKYFLGQAVPPNKRVTTCQKCIRTPDIESVGKTARHGTYFEMLGNFSFGDYFKKDATKWAWEFLTQVLEIPEEKLYVSIYQDDDEAFRIWTQERGLPPEKIVRLGKEDNFWEHGSGPCGPCSEIYFDRGEEYGCGKPTCGVGCDCDRYMEIWNLVFSEFDSDGKGHYTPFEHPNIDTGMGLERLACVMQGVDNLFEVDTVQNIMKHICRLTGTQYHKDHKTDVALRVITDHIRSTTMMVGDGVTPSNEGRGYVLRRLLRRAARYGRLLGVHEPFLYKVASTVIQENETAYPELRENEDYIIKVIQVEEERFSKTIDQGMELLGEMLDRMETRHISTLSGSDAFRLYDTFGFPIDLTREILAEKSMTLDEGEFTRLMKDQRERARAAHGGPNAFGGADDPLASLQAGEHQFVGYDRTCCETSVAAMAHEGERVDTIIAGQEAVVYLAQTPFYAESGGQVGDTGVIQGEHGCFRVRDCKKTPSGYFAHIGTVEEGRLTQDGAVTARIDEHRRAAIMRNHSACHLLQAALRTVLGEHVHQAGSLVDEHHCRFDFTHFSAMTPEEIRRTESLVNDMIFAAMNVTVEELPIDEAKKKGAMALFGEKYGDIVRVCSMGDKSVEFCGGTHVNNTARIGLFKIVAESSVAAGVRRIEAVTGEGVLELFDRLNDMASAVCRRLKVSAPAEIPAKVEAFLAEVKEKDKAIEQLSSKLAAMEIEGLFNNYQSVGPVNFITASFSGTTADALRLMADKVRERAPKMVAVLVGTGGEKATLVTSCGPEAVKAGVHAGKLMKQITALCSGSGGGRPESAMGGASDVFKVDEAIAQVPEMIRKMVEQ